MARIFVHALRRYLAELQEDPRQEKFPQLLTSPEKAIR